MWVPACTHPGLHWSHRQHTGHQATGAFQAGPQGASATDCPALLAGCTSRVERDAACKAAVTSVVGEEILLFLESILLLNVSVHVCDWASDHHVS